MDIQKSVILITGDRGFIAGYVIQKLLNDDHIVIGIDNDWKYGPQTKEFDLHPNYKHYTHDAKDSKFISNILVSHRCDYFIPMAAKIGGISMFHELAYDLLSENEKLNASAFDAAVWAFTIKSNFKKIIAISSSMVFENATHYPTPEIAVKTSPPPNSTYGFQKLAVEYFCKGASEQYKLPYTICRPFNCVGLGEKKALMEKKIKSGNLELTMGHVVPDLIKKIYLKQTPLEIFGSGQQVRHYTYGADLANGIVECIFNPNAFNEDFNLSTDETTTVLQLISAIEHKMNIKVSSIIHAAPFKYDVPCRIPDTTKAKKLLNFTATTSLDQILDEVVPWVCKMIEENQI